jgi:hypothetical protein
MASITKEHARKLVRKLKATVTTNTKAHDLAEVHHNGVLIASFGIRRGSNKNLPHPHIPNDVHLNRRETLDLANCPMSVEQWHQRLIEAGVMDADDLPEEPDNENDENG